MLKEMTGEFPALSEVFVAERDVFLTNSLKTASIPVRSPEEPYGKDIKVSRKNSELTNG
jgi:hypothetical protein